MKVRIAVITMRDLQARLRNSVVNDLQTTKLVDADLAFVEIRPVHRLVGSEAKMRTMLGDARTLPVVWQQD